MKLQVAHTIHYFQSRKTVTMYPIRSDLINRRVWTDNTVELRLPSRRCVQGPQRGHEGVEKGEGEGG